MMQVFDKRQKHIKYLFLTLDTESLSTVLFLCLILTGDSAGLFIAGLGNVLFCLLLHLSLLFLIFCLSLASSSTEIKHKILGYLCCKFEYQFIV